MGQFSRKIREWRNSGTLHVALLWRNHWKIICAAGAFIIYTILQNIINRAIDPYISCLFNETGNGLNFLINYNLSVINSNSTAFALTVVIIGVIAGWQVRKAKGDAEDWKTLCSKLTQGLGEANKELQQYRIEQTQLSPQNGSELKKIELKAHLYLDDTTTNEILYYTAIEKLNNSKTNGK